MGAVRCYPMLSWSNLHLARLTFLIDPVSTFINYIYISFWHFLFLAILAQVFPDAVALLRWRDRNQRMLPKLALDGIVQILDFSELNLQHIRATNRKFVVPCFCCSLHVNSSATIHEYPPRMSAASKQDCTSSSNTSFWTWFNMVHLCSTHLCLGAPSIYTSPCDLKHRCAESSDLVTTSNALWGHKRFSWAADPLFAARGQGRTETVSMHSLLVLAFK